MLSCEFLFLFFFFSSRRRHTRLVSDWSSDVCSSDLDQFAVASLFGDFAVFKDQNSIRHTYGREAMRNEKRHLAMGQFRESPEHFTLGSGIQRCGGFVEDQQL